MDAALIAVPLAGALAYLLRSYARQSALLTAAIIAANATMTSSLSSLAATMASWSSRPCLLNQPEGASRATVGSNPGAPADQQLEP